MIRLNCQGYWSCLVICLLAFRFVSCLDGADLSGYIGHQRRALANPPTLRPRNISSYALDEAQRLVSAAVKQQSEYNLYRIANPRRNTYKSKPVGDVISRKTTRDNEPRPPVLDGKLKAAAALVAEHAAAKKLANATLHRSYHEFEDLPNPLNISHRLSKRATGDYWLTQVDHGQPPMGWNPSYPVWRDVTQYGAKGDGVTDDTAAINAAIAYGDNCGADCLSSSTKGTAIYFPPGTYLISSPINAYYYSQLIGDANDLPIIKTSPDFIGLGAIQSDVYIPNANAKEWYIVQSNFYRQVRDLIIDITQTTTAGAAGLHWQVGQATSVTEVQILASTDPATTQMGIFTENGSGGFMSDCRIVGGQYGIFGGNQQFTVRNFQIKSATSAAIALIWDWGWTWTGLYLADSPVGILVLNPKDETPQDPGSTYIMDSTFDSTTIAIKANFEKFTILDTSIITLDNIAVIGNVQTVLTYANGNTQAIPVGNIDFVVVGNVESGGQSLGQFNYTRDRPDDSLLALQATGPLPGMYSKPRPLYSDITLPYIIDVKQHGAKGDGAADDTDAIRAALASAGEGYLVYFPPGSYIITSTIVIPSSIQITGLVWSQLVASGPFFADIKNPKPMIQVGQKGDVGHVEISDILFTSVGSLPGLILVEWNIQARWQGEAGIWDSHFRVGGAYGSKLQVAQCPKSEPIQSNCIAASMMLHITKESNGYFENVWAWVADHDIDDPKNDQITVAVARGILVEAQNATWLFGTASEHSMLYQYNFASSSNTFAGMIQTESAYFQGTPATESPGPFGVTLGVFNADPIFPDPSCTASGELCNVGWAVIVNGTQNLTVAGAGLYSWFDNYVEACVDSQNCQQRMINNAGGNSQFRLWNLITIGAVEMMSMTQSDGAILAKDNTQAIAHPFWSALAGYLDDDSILGLVSCSEDDVDCGDVSEPLRCDLSQPEFPDLDSLQLAEIQSQIPIFGGILGPTMSPECAQYYTFGALSNMLEASMKNYNDVNNGYEREFGYYVDYMKDQVKEILATFMADSVSAFGPGGPGNKYFKCTNEQKETSPCPPHEGTGYGGYTVRYDFNDDAAEAAFYEELKTKYGISREWVVLKNFDIPGVKSQPCHQGDRCPPAIQPSTLENFPQSIQRDKINIINPKDIITQILPTLDDLRAGLFGAHMETISGTSLSAVDDLIQVLSLPVFQIQSAVDSMSSAKDIGAQIDKQKKIDLIVQILGAVFAVIPFLDEALPAFLAAKAIFTIISEISNVGLAIEGMVADPSSAPWEILGLITGPAGRRAGESEISELANARRGLTSGDIESLGQKVKKSDDKLQDIIKFPVCGR